MKSVFPKCWRFPLKFIKILLHGRYLTQRRKLLAISVASVHVTQWGTMLSTLRTSLFWTKCLYNKVPETPFYLVKCRIVKKAEQTGIYTISTKLESLPHTLGFQKPLYLNSICFRFTSKTLATTTTSGQESRALQGLWWLGGKKLRKDKTDMLKDTYGQTYTNWDW